MHLLFKTTLIFLFIFTCKLNVSSQQHVIDSLKTELKNVVDDLQKCQILYGLAEICNDEEWPKFNILLKNTALKNIDLKNNVSKFNKFVVIALNNEGYYYKIKGEVERAKKLHFEALKIASKEKYVAGKSASYAHLALIFKNQGNYLQAIDYNLKCLNIEKELGNFEDMAYTLNNIGAIHYTVGDSQKALIYFEQCYEIQRKIGDLEGQSYSLMNIGSIYLKGKEDRKAIPYFNKAKAIIDKSEEIQGKSLITNYLGNVYFNTGEFKKALGFYEESLKIKLSQGELLGIATVEQNIAKTNLKLNNYLLAKEFSLKSYKTARRIKNIELIKETSYILYQVYKKENNLEGALKMHEIYNVMKDSSLNESNRNRVYKSHLDYEYDLKKITDSISIRKEKEKEISQLKTAEKIQQIEYKSLKAKNSAQLTVNIVVIIFLLISVLFIYSYVKRYKEKNKLNLELEQSLIERDLLNKEIHHRVKNNLQIISSLLNMQKMDQSDESVKDILQQSQNRIQSMALIHEKLYQSGNLKDVKLDEYLTTLMEYFAFNYDFKVKNVAYEIAIPSIQINTDKLIPLGLIANEIILNSLKYAFGENSENKLEVRGEIVGSFLNLTFQDNGRGLPDDWAERSKKSLGTTLIRGLTRQLKGKIEFVSKNGTQIKINIPID